ncbi:thioredoxin family protein [candidate division WOR-3 bacterium]|nr:thioredoxin family protein [candidate division WOR-3 bacterium]
MNARLLGTGCARCNEIERRVMYVLAEMNIMADIEYVRDL